MWIKGARTAPLIGMVRTRKSKELMIKEVSNYPVRMTGQQLNTVLAALRDYQEERSRVTILPCDPT